MRPAWAALALAVLPLAAPGRRAAAQTDRPPKATFRFSPDAGRALQALWTESVAAKQERVACLAASVRNDTVFVSRILPLSWRSADSSHALTSTLRSS